VNAGPGTYFPFVNGKSGVSAEMAIRLDKAFGGGAEVWLGLQMDYGPKIPGHKLHLP
jgi:plasmid maintenance system antidote protein VapI